MQNLQTINEKQKRPYPQHIDGCNKYKTNKKLKQSTDFTFLETLMVRDGCIVFYSSIMVPVV